MGAGDPNSRLPLELSLALYLRFCRGAVFSGLKHPFWLTKLTGLTSPLPEDARAGTRAGKGLLGGAAACRFCTVTHAGERCLVVLKSPQHAH